MTATNQLKELPPNTNDSTTAGFIAPSVVPEYDKALDIVIRTAIQGITNLPGWLVRRRWQSEPSTQPPNDYDWCSAGVVRTYPDTWTYQRHDPSRGVDGDGIAQGALVSQHDELHEVLVSFFGDSASTNEATLRAGWNVQQNRDAIKRLTANSIEFVEQRGGVVLPSLLKEKWVRRVDTTLVLRRRAEFEFPVRTILSGVFTVHTDVGTVDTPTIVTNPPTI